MSNVRHRCVGRGSISGACGAARPLACAGLSGLSVLRRPAVGPWQLSRFARGDSLWRQGARARCARGRRASLSGAAGVHGHNGLSAVIVRTCLYLWGSRCLRCRRCLTPPSSGQPPASRCLPLMSNVMRPRSSVEGGLSGGSFARGNGPCRPRLQWPRAYIGAVPRSLACCGLCKRALYGS